jgi:hypothetical protein
MAAFRIRQGAEFSQLVAALSDSARSELAEIYRALASGPLPSQSLLHVEPYPGLPDTYTVPFRGGLLVYVVPPGKLVVGMVAMVGVER